MWNIMWFMRMVRWARNPPALRRVIMVFAIIAALLTIVGIEKFIGWPDALKLERAPKRVKISPLETDN
jgi:hypothetical protein